MSYIGLHGDPPCEYSGDHHYRGGGVCTSCGERLRCWCGRYIRVDQIDEHAKTCPAIEDMADEEQPA